VKWLFEGRDWPVNNSQHGPAVRLGDNIDGLSSHSMLRKRFHIGDTLTKSRLSFTVPESVPYSNLKRTPFRDPAALPMLQHIAEGLHAQGYKVTQPKTGKACHGVCQVIFPDVEIEVVLLVRRCRGKVEFEVLTWPSQTLRQRISGRRMKSADCTEWAELCSAMHTVLAENSRVESILLRTFSEGEDSF
jgi:hypothetical protein